MNRHSASLAVVLLVLNALSSLQAPVIHLSGSANGSAPSLPGREARDSGRSSQDPPPSNRRLIRTYGKRTSNTKTLSELVNKRPAPRKGEGAMRPYQALFAKHAKVQELDKHTNPLNLKALQEGWTALRREEKGYYNAKKMAVSIEDHLREVVKMPEDVVELVRFHWDSDVQKNKGIRFRHRMMTAISPTHAAMYQARLKRNKDIMKESRAQRRQGIVRKPFEDYMAAYNIPLDLPAKELEVKSRAFRHEYGKAVSASTLALRKYMEAKGYDAHQIALAIGERSADCKREQAKRYREQRRNRRDDKSPTTEQQQRLQDDGEMKEMTRKRKIQEMLTSNKEWYKTSNL